MDDMYLSESKISISSVETDCQDDSGEYKIQEYLFLVGFHILQHLFNISLKAIIRT